MAKNIICHTNTKPTAPQHRSSLSTEPLQLSDIRGKKSGPNCANSNSRKKSQCSGSSQHTIFSHQYLWLSFKHV